MADSSYNSGRAADTTSLVVGGGRAAVFTPNPYGGLQWYIKWPLNKVDGNQYSGLAFKLAADSEFVPEVAAGIQVQPNVQKASRVACCSPRGLAGGASRVLDMRGSRFARTEPAMWPQPPAGQFCKYPACALLCPGITPPSPLVGRAP